MTTRPPSVKTVRLALELLKRIPRKSYVTASDLHKQLQAAGIHRTKRTIERQLEALVDEFDIECDNRTRPFGFRWKSHAKGLSLPMLNEQESLLLALAQKYLLNLLPATVMRSLDSFFYQAKANLVGASDWAPEAEWLSKVLVVDVTQPLLPPTIDSEVFDAVTVALFKNLWLTIEYENAAHRFAEYRVMPLGLAQQGPRLYLVCRFDKYDNERSLALHRIRKATASSIEFTRPVDFSREKYDADGRFGFGEGERVKLTFSIAKVAGQHLSETRLSLDQVMSEHEDHYTVEATVVDSARLDWWLNGFGDDVWGVNKQSLPD